MKRIDYRRTCSSCLARLRFGNPSGDWTIISVSTNAFEHLRTAAKEFDALSAKSGDPVAALTFMEWVAPSITGSTRHLPSMRVPESDGAPPRNEGTKNSTVHRHPDPVPYSGPMRKKVAA